MLSKWNTLLEAAEWLSEMTGQPWTWRNVIERFLRSFPETVHVIIEPNTRFYFYGKKLEVESAGFVFKHTAAPEEMVNSTPIIVQSCDVEHFLRTILLGKDYESACGYAARFVNGEAGKERKDYRMIDPVPASAIRLTRMEVMNLLGDRVWGILLDDLDTSAELSPQSVNPPDSKQAECEVEDNGSVIDLIDRDYWSELITETAVKYSKEYGRTPGKSTLWSLLINIVPVNRGERGFRKNEKGERKEKQVIRHIWNNNSEELSYASFVKRYDKYFK